MIDRVARDQLAAQLRHLASGLISNDQFEEMLAVSEDRGVREVREAAWMLYTDLREQWLRGKDALAPRSRRAVARWIVFLHSDLEYEWPKHPWPSSTSQPPGPSGSSPRWPRREPAT